MSPPAGDDAAVIREQAKRYLVAVYGPEWLYRAPESFEGSHGWIWAVANGQAAMAEAAMARVEQVCAERGAVVADGPLTMPRDEFELVRKLEAALRRHMQSFTEPKLGEDLCGGCLNPVPGPDAALCGEEATP